MTLINEAKKMLEGITPFPWEIRSNAKTAINKGPKHIAMVNFYKSGNPISDVGEVEHEANVNLIAKAPELISKLISALEQSEKEKERYKEALLWIERSEVLEDDLSLSRYGVLELLRMKAREALLTSANKN